MNCDDCIFAVVEDKVQTSCSMRKDPVHTMDELSDKGYWELWGLCQYNRTDNWEHKDKPLNDQKDIAREEAQITFDLCTLKESNLEKFRRFTYNKLRCALLTKTSARFMEVADGKELGILANERISFNLDTETDWRILFGREAKGVFFGCFEDFSYIPNGFFNWLDSQINDQGFRFSLASHSNDILISKMHFDNVQLSINNIIELNKSPQDLLDLTLKCVAGKTWDKGTDKWV